MNPKNGFKYRKTGGGEVDHLDIPKIYFHIYVKHRSCELCPFSVQTDSPPLRF